MCKPDDQNLNFNENWKQGNCVSFIKYMPNSQWYWIHAAP